MPYNVDFTPEPARPGEKVGAIRVVVAGVSMVIRWSCGSVVVVVV